MGPSPLPARGAHVCCGHSRPSQLLLSSCENQPACMAVSLSYPVCNVGVLWQNGWVDQDETWHGGRPLPRPHCARWGPSSPSPKKGHTPNLILGPCLLWPNGWMDQDATWYGGRPWYRPHCVRWGPSSLPKMGHSPTFQSMVYYGQTAGWIKMPFGTKVGLGPAHNMLHEEPAPPKRGTGPKFSAPMSIVAKRSPISATAEHL